jgi:formate hydrogenlyase subunit 3/multisubunit Na+/H+ antiporter MnhD subunit
LRVLSGGQAESLRLEWDASHGAFSVGLDALSAFFLVPVLGLSALAAVYGGNYLLPYRGKKSLGTSWFFFSMLVAGMVLVVIARTALLFLLAWEVMSLSAYFLVTFEDEKAEVRRAGWIYLVAAQLGAGFLFATFLLLGHHAESLDFDAIQQMPALDARWSGLLFVLALVGFGAKAGFVPFHVWLPEAHPAAPSHVSALMSGVLIKMGLYGLLRVLTFLGQPAVWWGPTLVGVGLVTALVGISLALIQRDMKRALAYSSIENMGLIALALGLGLWGAANRMPVVATLGMTAALLHIWNHALMKCLMFLAAGSVLHGTGTRDVEQLGGLLKRMPWTGAAMSVGAVAIAALPPLNGFVSKWLMYLGLMNYGLSSGGINGLPALLAVGVLALIGGLAALTFVRLTGIALLGSARSEAAGQAHESSPWMLGPMMILLALCVIVAVIPQHVVALLSGVLDQVLGQGTDGVLLELEASTAPLFALGIINTWLFIAIGLTATVLMFLTRRAASAEGPTWGCGYVRPTTRMQYTGTSFAEMLTDQLLPRFLRPRTLRKAPAGLFPAKGEFTSECPDPVTEKVYEPLFAGWADRFTRLRVLQQGKVHVYLAYIMLIVLLALAWVSMRTWWDGS